MAETTSAWGKINTVEQTVNFSEILSEELAKNLEQRELEKQDLIKKKQLYEDFNFAKQLSVTLNAPSSAADVTKVKTDNEPLPVPMLSDPGEGHSKNLIMIEDLQSVGSHSLDSPAVVEDVEKTDEMIAQLLQAEFDLEYDEELKRVEKSRNKDSKISISFQKYRMYPDDMLFDSDDEEPEDPTLKKDWDVFEKNDKEISKIGRTGYNINESGEMITKHDANLSGRKNACKVMSFAPEIQTGDAASFDMKLDNKVFNQLRVQSKQLVKKTNRALDRKENMETTEMGLDEPTRLILYKMINNQLLESVDGVVSTGKEAIILHGETDPNCPDRTGLPKEVAIKIFSTTLNEFKQRDRYIKDDFRFKDRFSKQNNRTVIGMWAEKELHNLNRLKRAGIACPEVITLKKHVLVMSFIGKDTRPAPKLKEAVLSEAELICAYEEIVEIMCKMYQEARLIHADFSEYNILWWDGKPWVIDVAQSVEPIHPAALEYLMRDCGNITNFFSKRGVPDVKNKEDLFFHITNLDPLTSNTTMLERIHMKGEPVHVMTRPKVTDENAEIPDVPEQFKPLEFPFDYAWSKVENLKKKKREKKQHKDSNDSGKIILDNTVVNLGKEISVAHVD